MSMLCWLTLLLSFSLATILAAASVASLRPAPESPLGLPVTMDKSYYVLKFLSLFIIIINSKVHINNV